MATYPSTKTSRIPNYVKLSVWLDASWYLVAFWGAVSVIVILASWGINRGWMNSEASTAQSQRDVDSPMLDQVPLGAFMASINVDTSHPLPIAVGHFDTAAKAYQVVITINGRSASFAAPQSTVSTSNTVASARLSVDNAAIVQAKRYQYHCYPSGGFLFYSSSITCSPTSKIDAYNSASINEANNIVYARITVPIESDVGSNSINVSPVDGGSVNDPNTIVALLTRGSYHITIPSGTLTPTH